ncbi:hypothetical protein KAFR_0F01690 [Kazachstania africana CBS 2517]|uniref:Prefoldin subunit 1 n=1 Tax=Kazachstania africana (strain ATCC 22294 / BCRC 22015 / CBS 2517 / CECT 1963 / NBRC 1671 / NRRL Y-8276) TaxID=1071382 RepID=H2AWL6_KAZAF|nr:hypothetical protein KAFR_0F01690 [Kazachstania africana CBS 2517]CCF58766.1 hypothetical protein KAFR_0F01690 [Kazachstania africana CBS 2517]
MSAPQLAQEMAASLRSSKNELSSVNQQLAHLQRQEKLAQVTTKELESYPTEKVWRSCGKTFILQDKRRYLDDLSHDEGVLKEQRKNLEIKQNYLNTSVEKTMDNLRELMKKSQT